MKHTDTEKQKRAQQLREAADIIEQGLEWEAREEGGGWFAPSLTGLPSFYLNNGLEIRRKELPPLKWAKEREAFERGEKIESRFLKSPPWAHDETPMWDNPSYEFRIAKPAPVTVPLCAEDVPPGSVIRTTGDNRLWWLVLCVCGIGIHYTGNEQILPWGDLKDGYEIKRPGEDWKPCSKEKEGE